MKLRKIFKIVEGQKFKVRMQDLKKGDIFELLDIDDTPVGELWEAVSDGWLHKDGYGMVNADSIKST